MVGYTKVNVTGDGMGFIIGNKTYAGNIRTDGVGIYDLRIIGNPSARSGIRIGSDSSFVTPTNVTISNVGVYDFDNLNVKQITYDNSIPAFGSTDSNDEGTFDFYGACGIFIAGVVGLKVVDTKLQNCRYGLGESAGGFATTATFSNCKFRTGDVGVKIYTANNFIFNNATVFESLDSSAVECIIPVSAISRLQRGVSSIIFSNSHVENTNTDGFGYCFDFQNFNGVEMSNFVWRDCKLSFVNHGWRFRRVDQAIINDNGIISLNSGDTLVNCNSIQYVEYKGYINSNYKFGEHKNFRKIHTNEQSQGIMNYDAGGLAKEWRQAGTTGVTTEENIIVGGNVNIWSINNKDYVNELDRGFLVIESQGTFAANDNQKTIRFLVDAVEIGTNSTITHPNGVPWEVKIKLKRYDNTNARYIVTLKIGNQNEVIYEGVIFDTDFWLEEHRFYVKGKNGVASTNDIICNGTHSTYYSIID